MMDVRDTIWRREISFCLTKHFAGSTLTRVGISPQFYRASVQKEEKFIYIIIYAAES